MKPVRILVIDDDKTIIDLLQSTLFGEGWRVITAENGAESLIKVEKDSPDLVILDMMMPGIDGFEVCRRLRQWSQVPVIALSALGETKDKVKCLNLGADDYITKPFKIDELIARVKAVLRRNRVGVAIPSESPFVCDGIKLDFVKRKVYVANNEVIFTPTEYNLLIELATNANKVLTYTDLLRRIWGQEFIEQREYLYVQICHLREKLEADPKRPKHIISVPRVGYRFQKQLE
jgi:two-component system, OmpR family, KDP operon response regulator KdpE